MSDIEPVLSLAQVSRSYGDHHALAAIDLDIAAGECVVLRGDNGSGKSTLLRLATGRDRPTAGLVRLGGEPLRDQDPDQRRKISVSLGTPSFYPDLSVRDHLELVALSHGLGDRAAALVAEVIADRGLHELADRMPASLSTGQLQSMLLATAFVRPFELLVLDEPEQRLDRTARSALADALITATEDGAAVLIATHDSELTDAVADEIIVLGDGVVLERQSVERDELDDDEQSDPEHPDSKHPDLRARRT